MKVIADIVTDSQYAANNCYWKEYLILCQVPYSTTKNV